MIPVHILCNPVRALLLALLLVLAGPNVSAQAAPQTAPKLVLLVAIDQFRYDYLSRFRNQYTGGLRRLLERGAVFVNANLEHYPTVTAVGHSTMLSGATPAISGIIGNDWYDREEGRQVTSVSDAGTKLLGAPGEAGSSPRRLLVSTVGDELKVAGSRESKVIGISMKDRSAVLPAGRMANAAYWYDDDSGAFVSSTYYFAELPGWVEAFNNRRQANAFAGKAWLEAANGTAVRKLPDNPGKELTTAVYNSPFGNDLVELFTEAAIDAERLGQRGVVDLLAVSFSSNDAIGHSYGPDSPEVHAVSIGVDRTLGRLFDYLDRRLGEGGYLVALTADHGVSPVPETLVAQNQAGGRIRGDFFAPIRNALEARFGPGKWVLSTAGSSPYLDYGLIAKHRLDPAEVRKVAAEAAASIPHVARVYTRDQLLKQRSAVDLIDSRVMRSFHARRSGDLEIILDPYWIRGTSGTTHGTPYNYDAHIPLIFMGPGIVAGRHYKAVALNDLAPTIAAILDIEPPSGSVGRVLDEIFATGAR
jgi:predicted AlkP superfamily pyrophosphatase or phosphodiesterase